MLTPSVYEKNWNFSKFFSSNSLLRKFSTVRRPIRGHRNGSKKITNFHSLNRLLIKNYFLPKLIRFMQQTELFQKNLNFLRTDSIYKKLERFWSFLVFKACLEKLRAFYQSNRSTILFEIIRSFRVWLDTSKFLKLFANQFSL